MKAQAFRQFYDYHFTENRTLWDRYVSQLFQKQFTHEVDYSHGSVRNHIVHLMSVDATWFSGLRGVAIPAPLDPAAYADRTMNRVRWDQVEHTMREYLATVRDEMLFDTP